MLQTAAVRRVAFGAGCAFVGVACGASEHERLGKFTGKVRHLVAGPSAGRFVDTTRPEPILDHAIKLAVDAPESCGVLSTNRVGDAPAVRVLLLRPPFGVERDGDDVSILFNTNRMSRKVRLLRNPRALRRTARCGAPVLHTHTHTPSPAPLRCSSFRQTRIAH